MTPKKVMIIAAVIAALLLIAWQIFYTVRTDQFVIVTQFGKAVATRVEPGLYLKVPAPIQVINRFDKKVQIYNSRLVEYLTKDKKNIIIQSFVCWRIVDPLHFFESVHSSENAEQKIDDIVQSLLGSTLGDYLITNLISTKPDDVKIEQIEKSITESANKKTSKDYGIAIETVGISRLALPEDNARSVYKRMIAERSTIANEYRALGKEEAAKIRAQADRERSQILADAYRQSQIIRGEGEAKAMEIYGQVYASDPELFRFMRTLEAYKKMLKQNTTLVLSTESDLFKYLYSIEGE